MTFTSSNIILDFESLYPSVLVDYEKFAKEDFKAYMDDYERKQINSNRK